MPGSVENGLGWSMGEKQAGLSLLDDNGSRNGGWLGDLKRKLMGGRRRRGRSIDLPSLPSSVSPSTLQFVFLCCLWYMSSAMSSNTGKALLNQFRYPVTLTFVQFGFISGYSLLLMSPLIQFSKLRTPTSAIVRSTLPMAVFQVGGHIFSSVAISRVPVSTVHTIKALSPLFTVAAYALLFRVRYSFKTYISLLPLTLGVMMACSSDFSASNFIGLISAFGSALIFVSSNIFFKKIMPSPSAHGHGSSTGGSSHKLDKLNLLFYSSGFAFLLMIPVWLYSDLGALLSPTVVHPPHSSTHGVAYYFFWNGLVHFGQNIIAFAILSNTSPVTYSIASLVKRIAVIVIAILWFNQTVYALQAFGIALTSVGLWMYNTAKGDVEKGEKKMLRVEAERQLMLPVTEEDRRIMDPSPPPQVTEKAGSYSLTISTGVQANASQVSPTLSHPPHASYPHPHPALPVYPHQHHPPASIQMRPTIPLYTYQSPTPVPPTGTYPSPPPSLDSPPDESKTFQFRPQRIVLAQRA